MASIPGTIPVTSGIAPTDTTDTFATHIDIYGQGGYMTVADAAARNSITEDRRKLGMAVCTTTDNKIFILTTNPAGATTVDTDWTEFTGGSSLAIEDEGTQLTAAAASIDFVGAGVTATNSGADVTVTIPGGASDLQSVLEGGSQFIIPNGYTGGILTMNYAGPTGDPSDPTINGTGILIDANSTGTNNGENLMIAASGSADAAFVTLHAQNVNSLPVGPVPYSRLEVKQDNIVVDTNSATWQNKQVGDVITIKSVNPGIGTNGSKYVIGPSAGVQSVKVTLTAADILNLHTTPVELIPAPGAGKFIQILSLYSFLDFQTIPYTTQTSGSGASAKSSAIMIKMGTSIPSSQFTADQENLVPFLPLGQSTDYRGAMNAFPRYDASLPTVNTWGENESLIAFSHLANTNGDSPIYVYISYMITDL